MKGGKINGKKYRSNFSETFVIDRTSNILTLHSSKVKLDRTEFARYTTEYESKDA